MHVIPLKKQLEMIKGKPYEAALQFKLDSQFVKQ